MGQGDFSNLYLASFDRKHIYYVPQEHDINLPPSLGFNSFFNFYTHKIIFYQSQH